MRAYEMQIEAKGITKEQLKNVTEDLGWFEIYTDESNNVVDFDGHGILSGGQSAELATAHLNAMNVAYPDLPWPLSFSYGRALQEPCLKAWVGKEENLRNAQHALLHREKCNSLACEGKYSEDMENAA